MSEVWRTSRIGGETRKRGVFGDVPLSLIGGFTVAGLIWLVLMVATKSLAVLIGGAILLLASWQLARKQTAIGDSWFRGWLDRSWFKFLGRRGRGSSWSPEQGLPAEVGPLRELVWSADRSPVAFIHQRHPKAAYGPGSHLTAVLEIVGGGDGLHMIGEANRRGEQFGQLLKSLAAPTSHVDQVDFETRVLPADPIAYQAAVAAMIADDCPVALRASMDQLAANAAGMTETYRSFMTVRLRLGQIQAGAGGGLNAEETAEAAADVLRGVVSRTQAAGFPVRAILGPRRYAAMIRHLYVPAFPIDDTESLRLVTDGWQWPYTSHKEGVEVHGPTGSWWHAVASVPRDAWPINAIGTRWLETLVADVNPRTIRTVKASHRLVSRSEARRSARIASTYDRAQVHTQTRKGQVSTGESEASESAANTVLRDVLEGAGGDRPSLRIAVSAPSLSELLKAREAMNESAEKANLVRLFWHDFRHHQAMLLMAPLGRGMKA